MDNVIRLGDTAGETQAWFKDRGAALRERYQRKPEMHLADFERKMNEVRLSLTPQSYRSSDIPNVAA